MVKWKNTDLSTYGIVVEKTPTISKGKKNIETYTIDGRSGFLSIDKGTYEPFTVSLECHAKDTADFNQIRALLDGYGALSFDDSKEYTAIINNAIPFEKVANFKGFIIQFLVNPIAKDKTATTVTISSSPSTINIPGATYKMEPIITIAGTGDAELTINNKVFSITDMEEGKTYTIDCELKEAIDNNGNNILNSTAGDFPELTPGANTIEYTGSITNLQITYKKTYI